MKRSKILIGIIAPVIISLFLFPIKAFALNKTVTVSTATATTSGVSVTGTTEALAVIIQVRDASDNILGMESVGTVSGAFSTSITGLSLAEGATYTVFVADYEGGTWTKVNTGVDIPAQFDSDLPARAPKTGDSPLPLIMALLLMVPGAGLCFTAVKKMR